MFRHSTEHVCRSHVSHLPSGTPSTAAVLWAGTLGSRHQLNPRPVCGLTPPTSISLQFHFLRDSNITNFTCPCGPPSGHPCTGWNPRLPLPTLWAIAACKILSTSPESWGCENLTLQQVCYCLGTFPNFFIKPIFPWYQTRQRPNKQDRKI